MAFAPGGLSRILVITLASYRGTNTERLYRRHSAIALACSRH